MRRTKKAFKNSLVINTKDFLKMKNKRRQKKKKKKRQFTRNSYWNLPKEEKQKIKEYEKEFLKKYA